MARESTVGRISEPPQTDHEIIQVSSPVTETDATGQAGTSQQDGLPPMCKSRLFTWRLLGAVLALLVVLGWVFIIVMLILEEKWQLVLVAWLLLYSAAHFCYWYCKRHSIISLRRQQIRLRVLTRMRSGDGKSEDTPPTYDEVMDTEAPPPAYFTVVEETTKGQQTPQNTRTTVTEPPSTEVVVSSQPEVATVSGLMQQVSAAEAREYLQCPPEYQTPRSMRKLSPRILPAVHQTRAPTDTAVTATAAATAIAAALTAAAPFQSNDDEEDDLEDPIRGPIVRHLRSTTIATLDVSSTEDVTPLVTPLVTPVVSRSPSPVSFERTDADLHTPRPITPVFA